MVQKVSVYIIILCMYVCNWHQNCLNSIIFFLFLPSDVKQFSEEQRTVLRVGVLPV